MRIEADQGEAEPLSQAVGLYPSFRTLAMSSSAFLTANFSRSGDRVSAQWRLTLDHRVPDVWAALTAADRLPQWLAPGTIELRLGGVARLDFEDSGGVIDSRVTAYEPERLLEYSWSIPGEPLRPLRWMLEPLGSATLLTLRLTVPPKEDAARAAAGWAAHLEMLQAALLGAPARFPYPVFKEAREAYAQQVSALRAPVETV
jgi:uncharacterized protein YndB with AHSA1/START domain